MVSEVEFRRIQIYSPLHQNAQAGHLSSIRIAMCIGNLCVFILNHAQGLLLSSKMWKL